MSLLGPRLRILVDILQPPNQASMRLQKVIEVHDDLTSMSGRHTIETRNEPIISGQSKGALWLRR
jgi:hypothetical protein